MKAHRRQLFLLAILALVLSACGPTPLSTGGATADPQAVQAGETMDEEAMDAEADEAMDDDTMDAGQTDKDETMAQESMEDDEMMDEMAEKDEGMADAGMEAEEKAMADETMDEAGMGDAMEDDRMSDKEEMSDKEMGADKEMDSEQMDDGKMDDQGMGGQEQGMGEMADEEAMMDEMGMEAPQTFRVRIENISADSGLATPLAPGVWVLHPEGTPLFEPGAPDRGLGLEALAEDGDPAPLAAALASQGLTVGIFDTPVGASGPGPLFPGEAYEFEVTGTKEARYLSFASMVVQSNDLFIAPQAQGIDLFKAHASDTMMDSEAQREMAVEVYLWDAGTEVDETPGSGPNQAPRQPAPNTGPEDPNPTVRQADPALGYPPVPMLVRVTITPVK